MFSTKQRTKAMETFIKYDHSYADTIAELGYPTRSTLGIWWKEYRATGEVPAGVYEREPRYSDGQRRVAVDHYLAHGKRLTRTMRMLGYPGSRETLACWADELAPGERKYRGPNPKAEPKPLATKVRVVAELEAREGSAAEVAERHGVSRTAPYIWRRELMGHNGGDGRPKERGIPAGKEFDDLPDDVEAPRDMLRAAKLRLRRVQLELDVRQATLDIIKKTRAPTRTGRPTRRRRSWRARLGPGGSPGRFSPRSAWPRAATSTRGTPSASIRSRHVWSPCFGSITSLAECQRRSPHSSNPGCFPTRVGSNRRYSATIA